MDPEAKTITVRKDGKVARILDGQHRIEGLRYHQEHKDLFTEEIEEFDLNVTIFVDLDIDDQAQIFSVINKAQTKVNKSLVYDLFEYARFRSPQKTAHDIVRLLNKMPASPFYRKIKILGTAENTELETIAQATFIELILEYTSHDPMKDRDMLRKTNLFKKSELQKLDNPKEISKYIFRNLFIDEKDEIILKNIWNYFAVVAQKWPSSWNENREGNILNKSTGIIALMRFYGSVVNQIGLYEELIPETTFKEVFNKITLNDGSFDKSIYIPGSSGQGKLFNDLKAFL